MTFTYGNYEDFTAAVDALETLGLTYTVVRGREFKPIGFGSIGSDSWTVTIEMPAQEVTH